MPLSDEEEAQLKALQEKRKQPAKPDPTVSYNIDLGNPDAVSLGRKLGLIPSDEPEESEEEEEADPEDSQQPRRRSTGADRWAGR